VKKARHIVISVCICTYRRPDLLKRLLLKLDDQETEGFFDYCIVIVDNDVGESARLIAESFSRSSKSAVSYHVEPEQNIALARNKAIENAMGEFVAFIDDDEAPAPRWLLNLFKACHSFHADGVLGPVVPHYELEPPKWVVEGKFYERPSHKTGEVLQWKNTRTGNVLLKRYVFEKEDNPFKPEFGSGGEDRDFFRRMIGKGFRFVWCAEAPVYEAVTPERCKRSFMVRRALQRGQLPQFTNVDLVKSIVAVPLYTVTLPFLLIVGHHLFMKYLVKNCDHIGRLLALCGIYLIKQKYVVK
jgi:succinoglycan biosynthesis protein ExoM